jgi:hypothetical protein
MNQIDLKHNYGVVRLKGAFQFDKPGELVFQSDAAAEAMEHLEMECHGNGAAHHHGIIFKDGNS